MSGGAADETDTAASDTLRAVLVPVTDERCSDQPWSPDQPTASHIGYIELNRPAALNALDVRMVEDMLKAMHAWRARRDEAGSLVFEHAVTGALQPSLPSEFDSWIEASDNALPSSVPFNPASSWRVAFTGPNRRGDMFFVQSTTDGDGPLKTRRDVPTEGCSGYAPS